MTDANNSGLIVDALLHTNPQLYSAIDAPNSWKASLIKRGARIKKYRRYEEGDHDAEMTLQMERMLRLRKDDADLNDLNVNYIRVVVDKMASRLYVNGVYDDDDTAQEWINETLERNDFEAKQISWWRGAVRDGNAFAMIDPVTLRWSDEPAYDGYSGIVMLYDSLTRAPIWACKLWSVADNVDAEEGGAPKVMKVAVYQPDKITYWKGDENGAGVVSDGDPIEWGAVGKIPVIDFANDRDSYTNYGTSRIRPAISQQNILNRISHSRVMGVEFTAFKVLYSIGFDINPDQHTPGGIIVVTPKDENGRPTASMSPEMIELLKAAKIGEFNESDTRAYIDHIDNAVRQIALSTNTPIYGVTSNGSLSGDALKQLEIGLLGEVERFQRQNSAAVKDVLELTAKIQNAFNTGLGSAPDFSKLSVIWKDATIRNKKEQMETLKIMRDILPSLGDDVFIEEAGSVLNWSPEKIAQMKEAVGNNQSLLFDALTGAAGNAV